MTCCNYNTVTFGGVPFTDIPYTGDAPPEIDVWYFIDGVLRNQNPVITVTATNVHVYHGGLSTGIIRIAA